MDKIKRKGDDFCMHVFENVKKFHGALMETMIWFYDPNYKGVLDNIERELHRTLTDKIIRAQVSHILLVFSRIKYYDNDRELRFKIKALQKTDPKHFGVN